MGAAEECCGWGLDPIRPPEKAFDRLRLALVSLLDRLLHIVMGVTDPRDGVDEQGRSKVGRTVSVRGKQPGLVLECGRNVGTPSKYVYAAVIMFPDGEIALWDCTQITFLD